MKTRRRLPGIGASAGQACRRRYGICQNIEGGGPPVIPVSGKGAKKCYAALVMGSPEREDVLLDYLLRDERSNNTMISAEGVEGAKPARMSYTATAAHNGLTL